MERLDGRVAVVTGAASGIGRALVDAWAAEGMKVVLADVEEPALLAAAEELKAQGSDFLAVRCDVSSPDEVRALADAAVERFGAVHVLCNNAGVGGGGPMHELALSDWQWVLGVNLWGVIHGVQAFLPILMAQDEAHVVNTASVAGLITTPFMGPYGVSKFGVVALSEILQHEMAIQQARVGVSVLCPGWVNTRIAESDRNRPDSLRDAARQASAAAGPMRQLLEQALASGMAPAEVARHVVDAVRSGRFYILTHDDLRPAIEQRGRAILDGRLAPFGGLG